MERRDKGHGVDQYTNNYCVVDLETTGIFIESARIIEIAAIKVRDGQVINEYHHLVNPQCHIPYGATAINGITDEMVAKSPKLNDIIDGFLAFIEDDAIVGYNNAGFDMIILYDAVMALRNKVFSNNYIDVLHAARRSQLNTDNYKLETISRYYALDTTGEHRALKDCYLTKSCYENLYKEYGDAIFRKHEDSLHSRPQYTVETQALQELQSTLEDIIEDGTVSMEEFNYLKVWIEKHRDLQGNYPFDRVFNAIDKVLADWSVTAEELEELQILFEDFVDPVKTMSVSSFSGSIKDKHICVTGDFDYGSRDKVFCLIEAAGGVIDKSVKKSTDILVVGAKGSDNWKAGNYGGKILKAMELKDKGKEILIIEEKDFIPVVSGYSGQESVEETSDRKPVVENGVDWKERIREMLKLLVDEYELPAGSLYLSDNYGQSEKTKGKLISHSVCIWEPSYPPMKGEKPGQNKIVVTITTDFLKGSPDLLELSLREDQEGDLQEFLPEDADVQSRTKSDLSSGTVRVRIDKKAPGLTEYIKANTIFCIRGYESKADSFACCSAYERCSDVRKCVHENKLYSMACQYRFNLDNGRIFYGKNRNID